MTFMIYTRRQILFEW